MQYITGMRTLYIYVVPKLVLTILSIALLRQEPLLWVGLAFLAMSWISSFAVQIPFQLKVRERADRVALARLLRTTWVRTLAMVGHRAVVCFATMRES